jgi:signal transduction histidine kinase
MAPTADDVTRRIVEEKLKPAFQRLADGGGDDHDILPSLYLMFFTRLDDIRRRLESLGTSQREGREAMERAIQDAVTRLEKLSPQLLALEVEQREALDTARHELTTGMHGQSGRLEELSGQLVALEGNQREALDAAKHELTTGMQGQSRRLGRLLSVLIVFAVISALALAAILVKLFQNP